MLHPAAPVLRARAPRHDVQCWQAEVDFDGTYLAAQLHGLCVLATASRAPFPA